MGVGGFDRRHVSVTWRGRRTTVELIGIDDKGHELELSSAASWHDMVAAAAKDGVKLAARTAFRSREFQQQLCDKRAAFVAYENKIALWKGGGQIGPAPEVVQFAAAANAPGTSRHEIGEAVDVDGAAQVGGAIEKWIGSHCERFGWGRPYVLSEPWHIERIVGPTGGI